MVTKSKQTPTPPKKPETPEPKTKGKRIHVQAADGGEIKEIDNSELLTRLVEVNENIEGSYFELSALLRMAYERNAHAEWGYENWEKFVDEKLDMSPRKSQYLMSIHVWFAETLKDPTIIDRVKGLGWRKVRSLVRVVDETNVDEWVARAKELTCGQLEEYIAKMKKGEPPKDGEEPESTSTVSFKLYPGQATNVEEALELAGKITGSEKRGNQLDQIAVSFRTSQVFATARPGEKLLKHYFAQIAASVGVSVIVIDADGIVMGESLIPHAAELASPIVRAETIDRLALDEGTIKTGKAGAWNDPEPEPPGAPEPGTDRPGNPAPLCA